jgi:hypothetical protein
MRRYAYVGPSAIREASKNAPLGIAIASPDDLRPHATGEPLTFVIDVVGTLRVAPRRSEHVACAGGGDVLSAVELTAVVDRNAARVVEVTNLSTLLTLHYQSGERDRFDRRLLVCHIRPK